MPNKAIMFVTHNLDEAPRLADRIAITKDGYLNPNSSPSIKTTKVEIINFLDPAMVLKSLFGLSRNK
jgi:ABC-type sugar transport system ATPase subunit